MGLSSKVFPNANDTVEFTGVSGANYANVDDDPVDDGDYNYSLASAIKTDQFTFADPGISGTINSLDFVLRAKTGAANPPNMLTVIWVYDGATWQPYTYDHGNPGTSYTNLSNSWSTNPQTGNPWLPGELDGAASAGHLGFIGYRRSPAGGSGYGYASNLYFQVNFLGSYSKTLTGNKQFSATISRKFHIGKSQAGEECFSGTLTRSRTYSKSLAADFRMQGKVYVLREILYLGVENP